MWAYATSANIPGRRELNVEQYVPYGHFGRPCFPVCSEVVSFEGGGGNEKKNCHRSGIVFAVWDIDVFDIFWSRLLHGAAVEEGENLLPIRIAISLW